MEFREWGEGDCGGGGAGYPGESNWRHWNRGRFRKRAESVEAVGLEVVSREMLIEERRCFLAGSGRGGGEGERELEVGVTSRTWYTTVSLLSGASRV